MAVQNEVWAKYVINRLWKDNQFLKFAFSDDQYVLGGKVVHIPNPGSKPTIVKNRSSYPATAVQRADTEVFYSLDRYTSDPTHIEAADSMEITYDKIESVFGDHAGELVQTVADDMIIKWLTGIAAPQIINSTGANVAAKITGQTTTRKIVLPADVKKVQLRMNLDNVPKMGRYAMLESNALDEFTDSLTINANREFSDYYDAKEGIVGRLYGFDFIERSTVAIASSGNVINALGAAVAATDNVVNIFWQKDSIARALGDRKFFEAKDDPQYYGDMYSMLLRAGGRRRRADNVGVVALIQAP